MKYKRDITTVEEISSLEPETLNHVLSEIGYDPSAGDFFFIKSDPNKVHIIENVDPDNRSVLYYNDGKTINVDETLPLFSAGTLIQILGVHQSVDLRDMKGSWVLIFDDRKVIESEEGELLVSFLWRALQILVAENILE